MNLEKLITRDKTVDESSVENLIRMAEEWLWGEYLEYYSTEENDDEAGAACDEWVEDMDDDDGTVQELIEYLGLEIHDPGDEEEVAVKSFYTHDGNLHTRETLVKCPLGYFIRTWSVLKSDHGAEKTVSQSEADEFQREAGNYRLDFDRTAYRI